MEEGMELQDHTERMDIDRLHKKVVRAGKRTYFFDVKSTRDNDFYIIITESKKCTNADGRFFYERHKVFLYEEDFDHFLNGLSELIELQKAGTPRKQSYVFRKAEREKTVEDNKEPDEPKEDFEDSFVNEYSNIEFDDLGKK